MNAHDENQAALGLDVRPDEVNSRNRPRNSGRSHPLHPIASQRGFRGTLLPTFIHIR